MSYKTASQQRSTARSTKSSEASVAASPSGGYNLYNVTASTVINEITITPGQVQTRSVPLGITITSISVTNSSYVPLSPPTSTVNTAGGYISILGNGFTPSSLTYIQGTLITATTYVSTNQINAQVPALNVSQVTTQQIYVANSSTNSAGILITGYQYGVVPYWTGSTTSAIASTNINFSLAALSDSTMTYAIISGSLPGGLTLNTSTGVITGSYSLGVNSSTTVTISATNLQNQYNTQTFNITILVQDPYYNYTSLLLNGETNTSTYIADASTNTFALTVSGAATPNRFNPLWGNGYYGNYFDGSSGYLTFTSGGLGLGSNWTIECWINLTSISGSSMAILSNLANGPTAGGYIWAIGSASSMYFTYYNTSGSGPSTTGTFTFNLITWYHVAVVGQGGTATFYVNGISQGGGSIATSMSNSYTNYIGGNANSSYLFRFPGYISNLRVVNGTAVYTSNFTPPTAPLTAITNTALLTCQSANFVDNSTNAFTLSPSGTVKVVPNQPFVALPSSVQNYGSSLFDGSTGYLSAPSGAGALGTNPFTIEFWYYGIANGNAYATVVSKNVTGSPSSGTWGFGINFNGTPSVWFSYYTTGFVDVQTSQAVSNQQWHHIAATRNGTVLNLYLDGVLTQTATLPSNFSFGPSSDPTLIGYNSRNSAYINGYISNLRIVNGTAVYTSAFTPPTTPLTAIANTALLTLQNKNGANNNTFYDDSVNNFAITRTGTPTQGTFTPFSQTGWSNYFDGSTGYLNVTAPSMSGTWTVEFWVFSTVAGTQQTFLNFNTGGGFAGINIWKNTSNYIVVDDGTNAQTAFTSATVVSNVWNHIAIVRNGTTTTGYLNGVSVGSNTFTPGSINNVTMGRYNSTPFYYYSGYISNVRVVSGTAVYTSNFTPSTTPLTAITNTSLLTCQSNRFLDNSTNAFTLTPSGTVQVQAFSPFAPGVSYSSANNGGSIYFNGSTDYLNAVGTSTVIGTGDFTIEFWAYINAAVSNAAVFVDMRASSSAVAPLIQMYTSNILYYSVGSSNVITGPALAFNQWYHIAVSRASGSTKMFVNGVQVGSTYTDSNTYVAQTNRPILGSYGDTVANRFNGYLSNLRILNQSLYTTTFTPPNAPPTPTANTSLLLLGTNTGVQDATGKNDIITYGSAKTQANTVKYGTGAMYFDGNTAYVTMSAASNQNLVLGTGSFTIEFWAYIATSSLTANLLDFRATTTNGIYPTLLLNSGALNYYVNGSTVITGSSPSISTWHHIALVRNSGTTTLYLDGTATGSAYTDSNSYLVGSAIAIGSSSYTLGSSYFNGYIDDLRITKGVARYTANFTPLASAAPTQ